MLKTATLGVGTVVGGDFVVERGLGGGGMGAVYVARQTSTGKHRALKVMHQDIASSADLQARFVQEARVGARIRSGHIVEVVAAGYDPGTGLLYLVMELLEGTDLRGYLRRRGPLSLVELREVFEQLCHGVSAAHDAGIVHRDLKPENIFLARPTQATALSFIVKVLDFGIAKLASEAGTQATAAVGSPLWMAPEQTAPGPVTPAADVWALGLIAFELLTGQSFWRSAGVTGAAPMHLLREILVEPIPPASERGGARVPPGFDAWFARCVAREAAARFPNAGMAWQSMRQFLSPSAHVISVRPAGPGAEADALAATAAGPGARASSNAGQTPLAVANAIVAPPTERTSSRPWAFMAVGASVGILGLVGGFLVATRPAASPAPVSALAIPASLPPPVAPSALAVPAPMQPLVAPPIGPGAAAPPPPAPSPLAAPAPKPIVVTASGGAGARPPQAALPGGFSDPYDHTTDAPASRIDKIDEAGTQRVRLFSRIVSNRSNVADVEVRVAMDYTPWHYTGCYTGTFRTLKERPEGTITVSFDIIDQLPRRVALVSSTFASRAMNDCVVSVASSQMINAAGSTGTGHVEYGFKFVVQ